MSAQPAGGTDTAAPPARAARPRSSRLPSSDELFRRTTPAEAGGDEPAQEGAADRPGAYGIGVETGIRIVDSSAGPASPEHPGSLAERRPTGRERHDEKITVYVSSDELIDLEHARLTLKRLGVKADRGRIVREAMAEVISDLERNGAAAVLVRRLRAE